MVPWRAKKGEAVRGWTAGGAVDGPATLRKGGGPGVAEPMEARGRSRAVAENAAMEGSARSCRVEWPAVQLASCGEGGSRGVSCGVNGGEGCGVSGMSWRRGSAGGGKKVTRRAWALECGWWKLRDPPAYERRRKDGAASGSCGRRELVGGDLEALDAEVG